MFYSIKVAPTRCHKTPSNTWVQLISRQPVVCRSHERALSTVDLPFCRNESSRHCIDKRDRWPSMPYLLIAIRSVSLAKETMGVISSTILSFLRATVPSIYDKFGAGLDVITLVQSRAYVCFAISPPSCSAELLVSVVLP